MEAGEQCILVRVREEGRNLTTRDSIHSGVCTNHNVNIRSRGRLRGTLLWLYKLSFLP